MPAKLFFGETGILDFLLQLKVIEIHNEAFFFFHIRNSCVEKFDVLHQLCSKCGLR